MLCSYFGKGYSAGAPSETQIIITSRLYKPNGTARPVLWLHSAGAGAVGAASLEPWTASNMPPLLRMITALGLPILSADCSGSGHWGNDSAQSRIADMLSFARSNADIKAHPTLAPIVMGVSMGGMLALNWARANPTLIRSLCLFYPAVDLQAIHDGTSGATAAASGTESAYGGSPAAFNSSVAAHNPAQNAAAHRAIPTHMQYSDSDTVVGSAAQSSFVSAVGNIDSRVISGAAHADMTKVDINKTQDFLHNYL